LIWSDPEFFPNDAVERPCRLLIAFGPTINLGNGPESTFEEAAVDTSLISTDIGASRADPVEKRNHGPALAS
jgi:hypothetical protein